MEVFDTTNRKFNILIVDDNPNNVRLASKIMVLRRFEWVNCYPENVPTHGFIT